MQKERQRSLNIKDPEAHRLAQAIADTTGESLTRAVTQALRERFERLEHQRGKASVDELLAIARRVSEKVKKPYLDHAELLYDEWGPAEVIIDTSAIAAVLFDEPEAARYVQSILNAERCLMSAGSFLELSIVLERQAGSDAVRQCDTFFRRAHIAIEPFTVEQAHIARQAFHDYGKGRHPAGLNFGDCFAYALSRITGDALLFKGEDFTKTDIAAAH